MPDYSLDQAVAQAVEPIQDVESLAASDCPVQASQCAATVVRQSPMQMWYWDVENKRWYAGIVQDSIAASMRAYELFFNRTGWRLVELKHVGQEDWEALLYKNQENRWLHKGEGSTAAIAICEAIKSASLADQPDESLGSTVGDGSVHGGAR
jgi:hypothetical protein